jgi:hypothetical protein
MYTIKKSMAAATLATLGFMSIHADAEANTPHSFSLGVEGAFYKYREPKFMETHGGMYGANAEYIYNFTDNFHCGLEARLLYGNVDYSSNGTGRDKNIKQWLFEPRGLLGYTFRGIALNPTLFSGLGYRYKSDHSGGNVSSTGHHGYDRTSQYLYVPIGMRFSSNFSEKWDWQTTAEFDIFLGGRQESDLQTFLGHKVTHDQTKGMGLKFDYLIGYKAAGTSKLSFGPYVNYWSIKKSKVVHDSLEPKNNTVEAGLKAKWKF